MKKLSNDLIQNTNKIGDIANDSYEDQLSLFLTPERLKIIKNLEEINPSVAKLYSTTIYILENEYPQYQTFIAHGVREIINNLTRDFKEKDGTKEGKDGTKEGKDGTKEGGDEYKKIKLFLQHHLIDRNNIDLDHYARVVVGLKNDQFMPIVHNSKNIKAPEGFKNNFHEFEKLLIEIWESSFSKRKREIDKIILNEPTKEVVNKFINASYHQNIKQYFFSKIDNPEWLEPLHKKGLLAPKESWLAAPFLIKMAAIKPDVFKIIKPFLENELKKGKEVNNFILQNILQIAVTFPKDKTSHTVNIANAFKVWVNKVDSISNMVGIAEIGKFLENLKERKEEKLTLEILEAILKLLEHESIVDYSPYGGSKEVKEINIITRFSSDDGIGNYCYEEILKKGKNVFIPDQNFELFKSLYSILSRPLENKDLRESKYHPAAIETHPQDKYNTDPVYQIIAGIRDAAESVFENNPDKAEEIFELLEKNKNKIFVRIILHLLRKFSEKNRERIDKYLTDKDCFDESLIHHEYYLLLQQEFKNISEANQNKILEFIEKGPDLTYDKDEKEKQKYTKYWRLRKLRCIKDGLSGKWKEEYKKSSQGTKEPENPEFLYHISPAMWVGEKSPKKEDDIKKMSAQEIVRYLQEWKPTGSFKDPTRRGLAAILEKDIENDPDKYLDNLLLFKNLSEPAYIRKIFEAFGKITNKLSKNWDQIIELGKWSLIQEKPDDKSRDHYDDDPDWSWCHKALARFLTSAIKNDEKEKLLLAYADDIFDILKNITLQKDDSLKKKNVSEEGDKYYQSAINSMHGEALEGIVEYGLWLGKNNKKEKAKLEITPVLDRLVNNSSYLETWAVFGRYLPWIDLITPEWTKDNLDKIFPEDGGKKFDAAWLSYINFVKPFDDVFKFLKGKYLYVLKSHFYTKNKSESTDRKLGQHIGIFYARKKINIGDDIMKALFEVPTNKWERASLFSFVGRSSQKSEDTEFFKEMMKRFQKLWEWRLENIKGHEKDYEVELKEFVWWYQSGCFEENWAIKQLYDVAVIHKIDLHWFAMEDGLERAIDKQHIEKVWEIVKRVILGNKAYFDTRYKKLAIKCLEYIKDNDLEGFEDDINEFINKIGEIFGPQAIEEFEGFLG